MRSVSSARWLAERLEHGSARGHVANRIASLWGHVAEPTRPIRLPRHACVIGIGGATLGGSGKTALAGALALELRSRGHRVAVVASAYKARAVRARRVGPDDRAECVGDEALALGRELRPSGIAVIGGGSRAQALDFAASAGADVILVDGLLQARPQRLSLSVLTLEARAPWGAARHPPAGDLRACPHKLSAAADLILIRDDASIAPGLADNPPLPAKPTLHWSTELVGARPPHGELVTCDELRRSRLGLILAVARPERIERELLHYGIQPLVRRLCGDHAVPRLGFRLLFDPRLQRTRACLDAWLTTSKCAAKLGRDSGFQPLLVLERRITLPEGLLSACEAAIARGPS